MSLYNLLTKRNIILAGILLLMIAGIASLFMWLRNPFGDEMQISNLGSYTQGQPIDRRTLQRIQHSLYTIIKQNYKGYITNNSLSDILVRKDSYIQAYDADQKLRTISFIVDIESIRQSYQVKYSYSENKEVTDSADYQYSNAVSCLPQDQMIYGYFYCQDVFTQMNGSNTPKLVIEWGATDNYDNSLLIQTRSDEQDFINYMIFDHYRKYHKLSHMNTPSVVRDIVRNTENNANSLTFTVTIDEKVSYKVSINYADKRTITIRDQQGVLVATNASAA